MTRPSQKMSEKKMFDFEKRELKRGMIKLHFSVVNENSALDDKLRDETAHSNMYWGEVKAFSSTYNALKRSATSDQAKRRQPKTGH